MIILCKIKKYIAEVDIIVCALRAKKVKHRLEQPPTPTEDISDDEIYQELIIYY